MENDVIAERLGNIIEKMEEQRGQNKEEHQGIMNRQDHTNGTVTEHEREIISIKISSAETMAYLKGMLKILTIIALVTPCIVGTIFALFIKNFRSDISKEIKVSIDDNNQKQFSQYIK